MYATVCQGSLLLFVMLLSSVAAFSQQREQKSSTKELKVLIAKASTREDHLRLAAYYRDQASDYRGPQKEHLADANRYDSNPPQYPSNYPTAAQH